MLLAAPTSRGQDLEARRSRLLAVGQSLLDYAADHERKLPSQLSLLYRGWYLRDLGAYVAPGSPKQLKTWQEIDAGSDYEVLAQALGTEPTLALVREKVAPAGLPRLVFRADRTMTVEGGAVTPPEPGPGDEPKPPVVEPPVVEPPIDQPPGDEPPIPTGAGSMLGADVETATEAGAAALGVAFVPGVLVKGVEAGGPAQRAGLSRGDIVVAIQGRPVRSETDLGLLLATCDLYQGVQLLTARGDRYLPIDVTSRIAVGTDEGLLGLVLVELNEDDRKQGYASGVRVEAVRNPGLRDQDVQEGDVLVAVEIVTAGPEPVEPVPQDVESVTQLRDLLERSPDAELILLTLLRGKERHSAMVDRIPEEDVEVTVIGDPKEMKSLIARLGDADPMERAAAADEIGLYGQGGLPALPHLIEALADKEATVRRSAAGAIAGIGPEPPAAKALPALVKLLGDPVALVRCAAAEALGVVAHVATGKVRQDAIARLMLAAAKDADSRGRTAARDALEALGEEAG